MHKPKLYKAYFIKINLIRKNVNAKTCLGKLFVFVCLFTFTELIMPSSTKFASIKDKYFFQTSTWSRGNKNQKYFVAVVEYDALQLNLICFSEKFLFK